MLKYWVNEMSSEENEMPIERARCIHCGSFFRTDEYDDICYHCEIKKENGEKLSVNFEPEIIRADFEIINVQTVRPKIKITQEYIDKQYGKYKPLKNMLTSLKHEKIDFNFSLYFIGIYIPTDRNPDLFSKKIFPRFKSGFELLCEPEAMEFAKYLVEGIKYMKFELDVVIPVPSSSGLVKKGPRLLTAKLARELGIDNGINIIKRVKKIRKSKSSGSDRPTIQEHIDSLSCEDKIFGKRVLLFDDIYTSGNTVGACVRLLKENKASDVKVVTLAKTMGW